MPKMPGPESLNRVSVGNPWQVRAPTGIGEAMRSAYGNLASGVGQWAGVGAAFEKTRNEGGINSKRTTQQQLARLNAETALARFKSTTSSALSDTLQSTSPDKMSGMSMAWREQYDEQARGLMSQFKDQLHPLDQHWLDQQLYSDAEIATVQAQEAEAKGELLAFTTALEDQVNGPIRGLINEVASLSGADRTAGLETIRSMVEDRIDESPLNSTEKFQKKREFNGLIEQAFIASVPVTELKNIDPRLSGGTVQGSYLRSKISYDLAGKDRDQKPQEYIPLNAAAVVNGINPGWRIVVHSGMGEHGSDRHRAKNGGRAADIYVLNERGEKIGMKNYPRETIAIYRGLAASGFKGLGYYGTGNPSIHIDDVRTGAWGPDKHSTSLPANIKFAIHRGRESIGGGFAHPAPPTMPTGVGPTMLPDLREAMAAQESSGNYFAIGPETRKGNRGYGRYQVMDFNVGPWTKAALGKEMTPYEFLSDPEAQDKVFHWKMGQYLKQYNGDLRMAVKSWYGFGKAPGGHPTGDQYVDQVLGRLGIDTPIKFDRTSPAASGYATRVAGVRTFGTDLTPDMFVSLGFDEITAAIDAREEQLEEENEKLRTDQFIEWDRMLAEDERIEDIEEINKMAQNLGMSDSERHQYYKAFDKLNEEMPGALYDELVDLSTSSIEALQARMSEPEMREYKGSPEYREMAKIVSQYESIADRELKARVTAMLNSTKEAPSSLFSTGLTFPDEEEAYARWNQTFLSGFYREWAQHPEWTEQDVWANVFEYNANRKRKSAEYELQITPVEIPTAMLGVGLNSKDAIRMAKPDTFEAARQRNLNYAKAGIGTEAHLSQQVELIEYWETLNRRLNTPVQKILSDIEPGEVRSDISSVYGSEVPPPPPEPPAPAKKPSFPAFSFEKTFNTESGTGGGGGY